MKKITITEEQFKRIVESEVTVESVGYHMSDSEEIMEYMWLRPQMTGLNLDIFVDDGGAYKRHGHVPLLLVRNGYGRECSDFIPFEISASAKVLDTSAEYHITYTDIFAVQDFIKTNVRALMDLADSRISHAEFLKKVRVPSYVMLENAEILAEMVTLRASDSDLPMDVWLDEGATYHGHAPRLKFRASSEQRTTREFSLMLLTNPPVIENFSEDSPLKKKDIEKLKMFVIKNLEQLLKLANGEIDYTGDFLPNMIKA